MCKLCQTKPVYEFTNKRKLCARCFIRYFEKKVLYTIRKFKMIKHGDIVGYFKSDHFRVVVLEEVLRMISKKGDITLINLPNVKAGYYLEDIPKRFKINKLAWTTTIDIESEYIISNLIKGITPKSEPVEDLTKNSKIIKPLYLFLDEEILLYAKLKKLKFKPAREKENKISRFLDELEKKHPEVKRAIVNGLLELYS